MFMVEYRAAVKTQTLNLDKYCTQLLELPSLHANKIGSMLANHKTHFQTSS